ncbi:methyltransferase family protein [Oceanibacterium hippocampi]|uniref:Isoprenylcysteine carboxyl methyltransferase (ICMT) family protein n=1 Tax=Oceanibacterium hippocampi TaxID=745714 RepID=A0A1Y5U0V5_9PROT|nr:isoprenylcysteine carboxylmethyltransferase family protein [Oceanibacterium hippocampi]SLN75793.1 hypothetical protein OCH7691_03964 [Oceanibacterium hippocampi]
MRIVRRLEQDGGFLFRWRSYLPLVIVPVGLPALYQAAQFEALWGERAEDIWMLACILLSIGGLAIRWLTVGFVPAGTSGRNTHEQRASFLNTTGLYSVVRNPLYLGNFVVILGIALATKSWWFVLIVALAYWLYIERIIAAEERFLAAKFGAGYLDWLGVTPAFLPAFRLWKRPAERFSLRTVLRREYNGVLSVGLAYYGLEAITDLAIEGESLRTWFQEDGIWSWSLAAALMLFLTLRTIKKNTRLLHVDGR